ncbi:MAG: adenine-specific methyltransferase EcoRI family protein [Muribaculaceae bacterium]
MAIIGSALLFYIAILEQWRNTCEMANNKGLRNAKAGKKDEFYTQLSDIENELRHYKSHFNGKTVLCNCDDPRISNFTKYFILNFRVLGLKKLITTCYKNQNIDLFSTNECEKAVYMVYTGTDNPNSIPTPEEIGVKELKGDGDFRSPECIELLKEADIVVTNPPFSLFREYVAQLIRYDKKFIIIGHQNAIGYSDIFPLLKNNQIWIGYGFKGGAAHFYSAYEDRAVAGNHKEGVIRVSGVMWFTNLDIDKRHEPLILYRMYNPELYPKYENFDAINIDKTVDIPVDYDGIMGVPITFMDKYCPDQFEIIGLGIANLGLEAGVMPYKPEHKKYRKDVQKRGAVDGDLYMMNGNVVCVPYSRILIKRR